MKTSVTPARRRTTKHNHEVDYAALLTSVRAAFTAATEGKAAVFLTDAAGLFELYLENLPASVRQQHNCHACKKFIDTYGSLAVVNEDGSLTSVMWDDTADTMYAAPFSQMALHVSRSRITSPFWSKLSTWGTPVTGDWTHLAVDAPKFAIHTSLAKTAGQRMAASKESFKAVLMALADVKPKVLNEVLHLFESTSVQGAEKFVGPVKWLLDLQRRPKGRAGENLLWLAVATAPEGYLHPRSSVVWPLVEAVDAGAGFERVKVMFDTMTAPLQYQRPQAPPSAGNVAQAEKIVEQLGIAASLERRFARLEDLKEITWRPIEPEAPTERGIFGHLKTKESIKETVTPLDLPAQLVSLEKFMRTVLPTAEQIELRVPYFGRFTAFATAVNEDAPPILKWDKEDNRNPISWHTYPNGSAASKWGISVGFVALTAIVPFPTNASMPFFHEGFLFVLKGCVDSATDNGNALFPEFLNQELFAVRSAIEAYSRGKDLQGREVASVCGWDMRKGGYCDASIRVLSCGRWSNYRIDRWD